MSHPVELFCDTDTFTVNHVIHSSMKGIKLKKTWSGRGGADCILCESRRVDWKDPVKVAAGFPITRLAADTHTLYEQMVVEGDGDVLRSPNDYIARKGLTSKPLTTDNQHNICITHSYINWMVLGTRVPL